MGLRDTFENLKDRILRGNDDEYYDDYEDDFYEDDFVEEDDGAYEETSESVRLRPTPLATPHAGAGILGNSVRPEAQSVSVRTRSGDLLAGEPSPSIGGYTSPSAFAGDAFRDGAMNAEVRSQDGPRMASLPPTVMKPQTYNDIQPIIRRIRTGQPVVLDLHRTPVPEAKRILDFCYGFALGSEGAMDELDDRVFVLLPSEEGLSQTDLERLAREGILRH